MRKVAIYSLTALVMMFGFFCLGCEESDENDPTTQDWIQKGLAYLGKGDGTSAYIAFSEARKLDIGNLDAKYGQVLANVLQLEETFGLFSEMLSGEGDSLLSFQTAPDDGINTQAAEIPDQIDPPDAQMCSDACEKFQSCGLLEDNGWSQDACADACLSLYPAQSLDCFLAVPDCNLGLEQCFASLGPSLQILLDDLFSDVLVEMNGNLDSLLENPDWALLVPQYNFTLFGLLAQPSLTGENDLSEVYYMRAIDSALNALFNLLFSLNVDFNPYYLATLDMDTLSLNSVNLADAKDVARWLDQYKTLIDLLLQDPIYTDFLMLQEKGGKALFQQAGQDIGWIFGEPARMIDHINREEDPQWDDAVRYLDGNSNEEWEPGEDLLVPGVGSLDYELTFALRDILLNLKVNFVDGLPFPVTTFNDLLIYLDVPWAANALDILYLLGFGETDFATSFRDPDEQGLRPLLETVSGVLGMVIDALETSAEGA